MSPLFEYECPRCGHKHEFLEKADSEKERQCKECGVFMQRTISVCYSRMFGAGVYAPSSRT